MAFALPNHTRAFSLSTLFGSSAEADTSSVVVTDSRLALAAAATNIDPNPTKGGDLIAMSGGTALIPEAGLSGSAGSPDSVSIPATTDISSYTVEDGDTLSGIAAKYGVSTNTILWANNLTIKSTIRPGMTLVILPVSGIRHTVVKGETLASLAATYHADADEIATYNGLAPGATIAAGSAIIIPGGELSAPAKSSSSSSSAKSSTSKSINEPYLGGSGAATPGYFSNPLPGGIITQSIHGWNAVDIGAHTGTPIYAAANGTVTVAKANGAWNGGYGNYVVVSDSNGTQTLYAHMSRVAATMGASVSAGEVIGYVGMTGEATGPHLHFEVRGAKNPFANCAVGRACSPQ